MDMSSNYCTEAGGTGSGWLSQWGDIEAYGTNGENDGIHALQACCACGGGSTPAPPTPPTQPPAPQTTPPTTSSFTTGPSGSNSCGAAAKIATSTECMEAATELGL